MSFWRSLLAIEDCNSSPQFFAGLGAARARTSAGDVEVANCFLSTDLAAWEATLKVTGIIVFVVEWTVASRLKWMLWIGNQCAGGGSGFSFI